jgi:hypothetical protein
MPFFADDPTLTAPPYALKSSISVADFRQFVSALEGDAVAITSKNIGGLSLPCDEFGFEELAMQLSKFRRSPAFKEGPMMEGTEARMWLSALEERAVEQARALASLQSALWPLSEAQESAGMAAAAALGQLPQVEAEVARMRPSGRRRRSPGRFRLRRLEQSRRRPARLKRPQPRRLQRLLRHSVL